MKLYAHWSCAVELIQLHAISRLRPEVEHLLRQEHRCGKTMAHAMRLGYLMERQARGMYGCEP